MGILLGLLSAFGFGVSDLVARFSTRQIGTFRTLFYMQFIGLIGLGGYALFSGELARQLSSANGVLLLTIAQSILNVCASFALYRSFEVGMLSIVSPIASSYSAFTVILALLVGEQLSHSRLAGIIAAIVGVVLASISTPETNSAASGVTRNGRRVPQGVLWAIAASAGYSVSFFILGFYITPVLGAVVPIAIYRLVSVLIMFSVALALRGGLARPRGQAWIPVAAIGILDTTAYVLMTIGLTTDQVSVVTVLSSLFAAVTVVLAWIFLRERMRWYQWLGIGFIFAGIILVSV
jgi:drug/metabolite transporter (DMT)-like permease